MDEQQQMLRRLRQLVEQAPGAYELYDADGVQIQVNAAWERLWGLAREHTVGTFRVFESKAFADQGLLPFVKLAYAGESVRVPPFRFDAGGSPQAEGQGRERWLSTVMYPIHDADGALTGVVITHQDVTATRRAEQALAESEAKYRDIFDNSLDGICILDADKRFVDANKATETLTGYSREELLQMSPSDLVHPDDRERSRQHFEQLDQTGFYTVYSGRLVTRTGETRHVEVSSNVIEQDGVAVGSRDILRDVTERRLAEDAQKALEAQLFVAQKMESVGQLAGGIAHDFNNILAGVMGYAELLSETFPDESTLEGEAAAVILKGAERASHLTRQLLGFARKGKYNPIPTDINATIRDVMEMSARILEERIRVTYDLMPDLPPVEADKSQIDQVLTNLIINARDAMPQGGELRFLTDWIHPDEVPGHPELEHAPSGYVKVSISDSGTGIEPELRQRIFEPFFSTKESRGTGLGLAMVYGIVRNHGGSIAVRSEVGQGSTFTVLLPAAFGTVPPPEPERAAVRGSGLVLVIDDEPDVRRVTTMQLQMLGYSVLEATDGVQGVARYREHSGSIDLVLVDMIMPNMDGAETFNALMELDPDVKVILMSGFSQEKRASAIVGDGVVGFLQKPFRRAALAGLVSKVLAG